MGPHGDLFSRREIPAPSPPINGGDGGKFSWERGQGTPYLPCPALPPLPTLTAMVRMWRKMREVAKRRVAEDAAGSSTEENAICVKNELMGVIVGSTR